jgi:uncharacterized protein (TIGR02001 family)
VVQSRRASPIHAGLLCIGIALLLTSPSVRAVSFGGDAAVTSDYIYRGLSETSHKGAVQLDLHASLSTGTFAGVWVSSLDHNYRPYTNYELEEYIGQRFDLSSAWNTSITVTNYQYPGARQYYWGDYQQIMASVSYLDRWTLSISAIPNALRYWGFDRIGRYPAYDAETSAQWLIWRGLYVTAGAGYYLFTGSGPDRDPYNEYSQPTIGYAYGNIGLAYEWRTLRLDVGYFRTQERAQMLFPYPYANQRVAGTLSWHF